MDIYSGNLAHFAQNIEECNDSKFSKYRLSRGIRICFPDYGDRDLYAVPVYDQPKALFKRKASMVVCNTRHTTTWMRMLSPI
nr:hypothetical protein [Olivibacter jilunii]